jgi:hypothetical protein
MNNSGYMTPNSTLHWNGYERKIVHDWSPRLVRVFCKIKINFYCALCRLLNDQICRNNLESAPASRQMVRRITMIYCERKEWYNLVCSSRLRHLVVWCVFASVSRKRITYFFKAKQRLLWEVMVLITTVCTFTTVKILQLVSVKKCTCLYSCNTAAFCEFFFCWTIVSSIYLLTI